MREVPLEQAQQFADYHNLLFLETSSKTGLNVEKTFIHLASKIYDLLEEGKFRIQEGWDGIKSGYMQSNPYMSGMAGGGGGGGLQSSSRPPINLVEVRNNNDHDSSGSSDGSKSVKKNCC